MQNKVLQIIICCLAMSYGLCAQPTEKPEFLQFQQSEWVDSVFSELSERERLAQLFMVAAYSNRDSVYEEELVKYVSDNGIGGVIFFQGGPGRQAVLTNRLQSQSEIPLLVAMDAEWGLKMRLDSTTRFPYAMTLGAIHDPHLIYEAGAAIAEDCRRLGVHINFAPVLDINNNPSNPVINFRSFGENKDEVLWRGYEFMKGMQDHGVMAVGKHFPGHGDTGTDSHLDLPTIPHERNRLDSIELHPFRFAIENGIGGMMVAHLDIPALDTSGVPSTLSNKIIDKLLKEEMGFEGLVFTDALNMKGVTKYYEPGEVDLLAFEAGNDVMLFSEDPSKAIDLIMGKVQSGEISQSEIDRRCRKVLAAKYWAGLSNYQPIKLNNLIDDLNTPHDELLNIQLAESAITLLRNEKDMVPVRNLKDAKIASVSIGDEEEKTIFQSTLDNYHPVDHYHISHQTSQRDLGNLVEKLKGYDLVLIGIHDLEVYPRNQFGITENDKFLIEKISESQNVVLTVFGNPYALSYFENLTSVEGLIVTYQETDILQSLTAQMIFGAIGSKGKLPVTINEEFRSGDGLIIPSINRLKYTVPEDAGLDSKVMHKIDSFATQAIRERAIPGCQVLAAKDGKVVWRKTYGFHTYDSIFPVQYEDLYDIASVTKVVGSLNALMKLHSEGRFDIDAPLSRYLPYFKRGDKSDLRFRDILTHQAGLKAWIPFWKSTVKKNGKFKWFTFKEDSSKRFPIKVTDNLYLHRKYKKKLYKKIRKSPLGEKEYVYSDLSFYLYPEIVENITGIPFQEYLKENFYQPLGANSITFNPYRKFSFEEVVPTEYDSLFRETLLHGTVHDEGAAMMGGLSGHAGLFANANDLAKVLQMWNNYGEYGGARYLSESTMYEFTRCQFCHEGNRRALGFDRPLEEPHINGNSAVSVSQRSFGHTGFTGTMIWIDPQYDIIYIFLSNRVHPTRENKKLFRLNTRTNIQEVIYEAMEKNKLSEVKNQEDK